MCTIDPIISTHMYNAKNVQCRALNSHALCMVLALFALDSYQVRLRTYIALYCKNERFEGLGGGFLQRKWVVAGSNCNA